MCPLGRVIASGQVDSLHLKTVGEKTVAGESASAVAAASVD